MTNEKLKVVTYTFYRKSNGKYFAGGQYLTCDPLESIYANIEKWLERGVKSFSSGETLHKQTLDYELDIVDNQVVKDNKNRVNFTCYSQCGQYYGCGHIISEHENIANIYDDIKVARDNGTLPLHGREQAQKILSIVVEVEGYTTRLIHYNDRIGFDYVFDDDGIYSTETSCSELECRESGCGFPNCSKEVIPFTSKEAMYLFALGLSTYGKKVMPLSSLKNINDYIAGNEKP